MADAQQPPRAYLVVSGLGLLLLGWLYGGDVSDALQARGAEVAAYAEPPSLAFALVVLVAALGGAAVTVVGVVQKRGGAWRGYRVMPIVTVVVLFVDLFFVFGSRSPLSSADRSQAVIAVLTNQANVIGTDDRVPSAQELEGMLQPFEPPAYLVKGVRPKGWTLVERKGCLGPVTDAGGANVGTIFYCVSADQKQAWLSLVALPLGQRFGPPQVMKRGDQVVFGLVQARPAEEPEDLQGVLPPGEEKGDLDAGP